MEPKIYSRQEHKIDQEKIDSDALHVMKKLREAGFVSYLVGGGVRDLLLEKQPKDFDISTSARPEEIKRLFKNCLLIGRRFRLAHLRFGKKVLELSTFRSGDPQASELIVRDNQWGSPEQDVLRRDFTMNGLFYDPAKDEVIDYVGGCEDLNQHLLRVIGNPSDRFIQDPVRMIRLLKFQARFAFKVDPQSEEALLKCQMEIVKSSPARILEETFKMLESGASKSFFELMVSSGLMSWLYPALDHFLKSQNANLVYEHLNIVDQNFCKDHRCFLDRSILTACLVFPILEKEIECQFPSSKPSLSEIFQLSHTLIRAFVTTSFPHFPRRLRTTLNFILDAQYRLRSKLYRKGGKERIFLHEDFPFALKFLELRSFLDPQVQELYSFWQERYDLSEFRPRPRNSYRFRPTRKKNETV